MGPTAVVAPLTYLWSRPSEVVVSSPPKREAEGGGGQFNGQHFPPLSCHRRIYIPKCLSIFLNRCSAGSPLHALPLFDEKHAPGVVASPTQPWAPIFF